MDKILAEETGLRVNRIWISTQEGEGHLEFRKTTALKNTRWT